MTDATGAPQDVNPLPDPNRIGIGWQLSTWTGWGVYGLNLTLQLAARGDHEPVLLHPPMERGVLNPLHRWLLQPVYDRQLQFQQLLDANAGKTFQCPFPVLHALGNRLDEDPGTRSIRGTPNVGMVFFEDSALGTVGRAAAGNYDLIVAGSTWNGARLRAEGVSHVCVALQGVDPTIFHPAPNNGLFHDRFVVFSGGKLEYRKGHDIVIGAFRRFQRRHPEALLVTAWHNAWPSGMRSFEAAGHVKGLPGLAEGGRLRIARWLRDNGLPDGSYMDLGPVPNFRMGEVLREMHVAAFPNRCEGGTNLVAMEAMACGLPTILSANTGHLDLVSDDVCFPLREQSPVAPVQGTSSVEDWGESSAEELDALLERVYEDREGATARGMAAARMMEGWTWKQQVGSLVRTLGE